MKKNIWLFIFSVLLAVTSLPSSASDRTASDPYLTVYIIRHGEKPKHGDNLSCKGMNRALALAKVLTEKVGKSAIIYVPSLDHGAGGKDNAKSPQTSGGGTTHARMFQTVTPYAVRNDLKIDSSHAVDDTEGVANDILKQQGTVLVVWEHNNIPEIARNLLRTKSDMSLTWNRRDFGSIWKITIENKNGPHGKLLVEKEGIKPSDECTF